MQHDDISEGLFGRPIHPVHSVDPSSNKVTGVIQVTRRRPLGSQTRIIETLTQQKQQLLLPPPTSHNDSASMDDDDQEAVPLFPCRVTLEPFSHLSSSSCRHGDNNINTTNSHNNGHWHDKVQSFRFQDFEGLEEFMTTAKAKILKRHPATLQLVHEKFLTIVQEIVHSQTIFSSILQPVHPLGEEKDEKATTTTVVPTQKVERTATMMMPDSDKNGWSTTVGTFATPNVRLKRGTYATFLHADAIYPPLVQTHSTNPKAMINIWMSLSDTPITNFPLCFYSCPRTETIFAENKLYYAMSNHDDDDKDENLGENETGHSPCLALQYDPNLTWGSFLCFVAGESVSSHHVLLHGAVNLEKEEEEENDGTTLPFQSSALAQHPQSWKKRQFHQQQPRQSLEMRFVV